MSNRQFQRNVNIKIEYPAHGGDLNWANETFGANSPWIDCSTGISPWSYPFKSIPSIEYQRLPSDHYPLIACAARYYECPEETILPASGVQSVISILPLLFKISSVAIPKIGYREHYLSWKRHGHRCVEYGSLTELKTLVTKKLVDHVVLINPNNPTAERISLSEICGLCDELKNQNEESFLIIDEAFVDLTPSKSVLKDRPSNCVVLRSFGKFFGLAGLRLGFVMASTQLCERLAPYFSPWAINGPAQSVAIEALSNTQWQGAHRKRLIKHNAEFKKALASMIPGASLRDGGLFITMIGNASLVQEVFLKWAERNILIRLGAWNDDLAWCRIGLPGDHMHEVYSRLMG